MSKWSLYTFAVLSRSKSHSKFWSDKTLSYQCHGLKVYCEGECKIKKHRTGSKRRVWRNPHIAVDTDPHEIIAAELSLSNVTDADVSPNPLKQTQSNITEISGDSKDCYEAI